MADNKVFPGDLFEIVKMFTRPPPENLAELVEQAIAREEATDKVVQWMMNAASRARS